MKKLILLCMFCLTQLSIAGDFPTTWKKTLITMSNCEIMATFWRLEGTPFAYLLINEKKVAMHKVRICQPSTKICTGKEFFISIPKGSGLDMMPTYEVSIPSMFMSSLPEIVISYSGVQNRCSMNYVVLEKHGVQEHLSSSSISDWDGFYEEFSNVGSIGHGK